MYIYDLGNDTRAINEMRNRMEGQLAEKELNYILDIDNRELQKQ